MSICRECCGARQESYRLRKDGTPSKDDAGYVCEDSAEWGFVGSYFNREAVKTTLQMGYWPPGTVLVNRTTQRRMVVVGEELSPQRLEAV